MKAPLLQEPVPDLTLLEPPKVGSAINRENRKFWCASGFLDWRAFRYAS